MIGVLPKSLLVGGALLPIRSDFRVALTIFEAYSDPELSARDKALTSLNCLYVNKPRDIAKALESAAWFLDGGDSAVTKPAHVKLIDWVQDENMIFPAVNKVAGCEVRSLPYVHWWTFLGWFSEMSECLFSQVVNIRKKRAKGKQLEKWEREFFDSHKELVVIREKLTEAEQAELDNEQALIERLVG